MEIIPIDRPWIHTHILLPYYQGCELVNQAWAGADRSIETSPFSWQERVIIWIKGMILLIPIVNTIIWLVWKTFGKPEKLADPFSPETNYVAPVAPPEIVICNVDEDEHLIERFGFTETRKDKPPVQTTWAIEHFPNVIIVTQNAVEFSSSALYRPDYSLKELHHQEGSKRIDFTRNDTEQNIQILVQISNNNGIDSTGTSIEIPRDAHWMQQRVAGFTPFIQSENQEMEFYAVIPEYPPLLQRFFSWFKPTPFAMKLKAVKMGEEEDPEFGRLIKLEITTTSGLPFSAFKSELWFDPATGALKKFIDSGGAFMNQNVGIRVQSSQCQ